jgi:hypothetical protein
MVTALLDMVGAGTLALSAAAGVPPPAGLCSDLLGFNSPLPAERPLAAKDLVRLRDIGPLQPDEQDARLFTLSPGGGRVAFQLRQADPDSNAYCLAMLVMDLDAPASPIAVDLGGDLIRATIDFRGKAGFPTGIPLVVTPRWSPDGRWIAFLKRTAGTTQVWRAYADGSGSEALTNSAIDVEDFRIGESGSSIVYVSRPGLAEARAAIEREGRSGFHYDDRYAPMASTRPFPAPPIERLYFVQDLSTGETRSPSAQERQLLDARDDVAQDVWTTSRSADGRKVSIIRTGALSGPSAGLVAETAGGNAVTCEATECSGAYRPWWAQDGTVRFFRREGRARASTAIYEWNPKARSTRRLYLTDDVLADCAPLANRLLCLREGSLQPRRLELLDLDQGSRRLLFDPNPDFSRLHLGQVERLRLRNTFGRRSRPSGRLSPRRALPVDRGSI